MPAKSRPAKDKCAVVYTGIGANPGGCSDEDTFVDTMQRLFPGEVKCQTTKTKDRNNQEHHRDCAQKWMDVSGALASRTLPPFWELPKRSQAALLRLVEGSAASHTLLRAPTSASDM